MLIRFKNSIVFFFLLAFLFPLVVREVHSSHHEVRISCDAGAQNHFHEHHEECHFCDVVMPTASEPSKALADITTHHFGEYIFPSCVVVAFSSFHFSSSQLRAPPVCPEGTPSELI